jgi:predicted SprT family Zn-dependent metalloprotease
MMNTIAPHEVCHIFAAYMHNQLCGHDERWAEIMQYINQPAEIAANISTNDVERTIAHLKYNYITRRGE